MIIYDSNSTKYGALQEYLLCVQELFIIRPNVDGSVFWVDSWNMSQMDLNEMILKNVELEIEGYLTILKDTKGFLVASEYATQSSFARLKARKFLFLTENEDPFVLLKDEILNCECFLFFLFFWDILSNDSEKFVFWYRKMGGRSFKMSGRFSNLYTEESHIEQEFYKNPEK